MFGRDARTNLDALTPILDGDSFRTGRHNCVAKRQQTFWELRGMPKRQQGEKNRRRAHHTGAIHRSSPGEQARVGNRVLIKEAARKLGSEGIHAKLAPEQGTGPWRITPSSSQV